MQIELQNLIQKITEAKKNSLPFVSYRLPNKNQVKTFFQKDDQLHHHNDFKASGFVFAPFDNQNKSIFFPLNKSELCLTDIENINLNDYFLKPDLNSKLKLTQKGDGTKKTYIKLINSCLNFLKIEKVSKIVLSRKEEISIGSDNALNIYLKLLLKYPLAFAYIWFHPKVGLWLGASPETLLKVNDNNFETMALAGTQSYNGNMHVSWADKEKIEQEVVSNYILSQLKGLHIKVGAPFTLKAGSLLHICTKFSGSLSSKNHLKKLVESLHPTPAICGFPKDKSKAFILNNENYNREFYTGYLGEANIHEKSNLFVNLRCMQIKKRMASLYVGGGITKDSIPEGEWEETIYKSNTIKAVL